MLFRSPFVAYRHHGFPITRRSRSCTLGVHGVGALSSRAGHTGKSADLFGFGCSAAHHGRLQHSSFWRIARRRSEESYERSVSPHVFRASVHWHLVHVFGTVTEGQRDLCRLTNRLHRTPRLRLGCRPDITGAGSVIRVVRRQHAYANIQLSSLSHQVVL